MKTFCQIIHGLKKQLIMKKLLCFLLIAHTLLSAAQNETKNEFTDYGFIIMDSPALLMTMRQVNESYLSGYRLLARGLYASTVNERVADLIQIGAQGLLLLPLTHEEGHRSVLTANHIGSVSQPYFNKHGAAYVKGVTDNTLRDLRDTDLPQYIRLHTAGLESDYMLTRRMEDIGSFVFDDFRHFKWEYILRKLGILQYYVSGLFRFDPGLEEEDDELKRDIVGYDTYGAARHLYRPQMDFFRYTRYNDLSADEMKFVKRMGFRSLLNLVNPMMIGHVSLNAGKHIKFNTGMGYTMSPFGDFIDETIRIKHKKLNISVYARQFQNSAHWFHGFGVSLLNYAITQNLYTSISGHFWEQPEGFDFFTSDRFAGGAVDFELRYFFLNKTGSRLNAVSIDLGFIHKTKGFLPEEMNLDEYTGLRIGTSIRL